MRTLPSVITTEKDKTSSAPWYILEIAFSSGTVRYASRDLSAYFASVPLIAVVNWGQFSTEIALEERNVNPISDVSIILQDNTPSGAILSTIRTYGIEGVTATIYIGFNGSGSTITPIFAGRISSPVSYIQEKRQVQIELVGKSQFYDKELLTQVTRDNVSYVAERDISKYIPIVYGSTVDEVPTLQTTAAPRTSLARRIQPTDTALYVNDGSSFPQGVTCTIRVGNELITGSFTGNLFNITTRGDTFLTSITTAPGSSGFELIDTGTLCNYPDNYFNNMLVEVDYTASGFGIQHLLIYDSYSIGGILYFTPSVVNRTGNIIQSGKSYKIITIPWTYEEDTEVVLHLLSYTWVVSDAPNTTVNAIYGQKNLTSGSSSLAYKDTKLSVIPVHLYTVNPTDTSVISGKSVTSVTMLWEPLQCSGAYTGLIIGIPLQPLELEACPFNSNNLYADLSTSLYHPSDVIKDFLITRMGVPSGDIDTASFTAVKTATSTLVFGFAQSSQLKGLEAVASLCFQATYALTWDSGQAKLHKLSMLHTSSKNISKEQVYDDTPTVELRDYTDIVNKLTIQYTKENELHIVTVQDTASIAAYEERSETYSFWAINEERMAKYAANFWLAMRSKPYEIFRCDTPLVCVELEPLDDVTLTDIRILNVNQIARIFKIEHVFGNAETETIDTLRLEMRVPIFPGCSSGCENTCEKAGAETTCTLSGCETGCEVGCQYSCKTHCQDACQLSSCTAGCEIHCTTAGEPRCFSSCENTCEPHIEEQYEILKL